MQALTIIDDVQNIQIFKPKPRRLIPYKKYHCSKPRTSSNNNIFSDYWKDNDKENDKESFNLENITLEEINNDFRMLNQKIEEELFYKEIMNNIYLCDSDKTQSSISHCKGYKKKKKSKQLEIFERI